ncbi:mycothiol synthase [Rathayibacter toxicus]|nr:mycothiol synthase [Rathayibacter toxicus]ALS56900.1 hypothetical protein APU90_03235 [Rathayibacter toxicus]QOD07900.1 mycothiol synthase [Rathayibacter toxicus]QOD10000.1 mycothiol synthase [Rathayibacter toxicus]
MSESLNFVRDDVADYAASHRLHNLIGRATRFDRQPPLSDQALVDIGAHTRTLLVGLHADIAVSAAVLGQGELEFVVDPEWRRLGIGTAMLEQVLVDEPGGLLAWAHGDHPAARALAASYGFVPVRTLLQLALNPLSASPIVMPEGFVLSDGHDLDVAEWVTLNHRIFAAHPEQGRITEDDLTSRLTERWYDEGDMLLLRNRAGTLVGYNWLKMEPGTSTGEIYVLGIAQEESGHGLGRALVAVGLTRMLARGRTAATLYVDADNRAAFHIYRSLGFTTVSSDVQYRRHAAAS